MKEQVYRAIKNPFISGSLIVTATNFVVGFLNYLFNSIASKSLGPGQYSEIAALFSYMVICTTPLLVLSNDLIRRLGSVKKNRNIYFIVWNKWYKKKLMQYWYGVLLLILFIPVIAYITKLSFFFSLVLLLSIFFAYLSVPYTAGLQALHLFFFFSGLTLLATAIKLSGFLGRFIGIDGLTSVGVGLITASIMPFVIMLFYFRRNEQSVSTANQRYGSLFLLIRRIILSKAFLLTAISLIGVTMLNNVDVIVAKHIFSSHDAGLYGAWNLFSKIVLYILAPLSSISYVFFSSNEYQKQHKLFLFISLGAVCLGGILLFFVYSFFGSYLINLILSEEYQYILPYLPYAALSGISYSLLLFMNNYLLARLYKGAVFSFVIAFIYCISLLFVRSFSQMVAVSTYMLLSGLALYGICLLASSSAIKSRVRKLL